MVVNSSQVLDVIVGVYLGDEGKGKIVEEETDRALGLNDGKRVVVVRFQGGNNAGHTLYPLDKRGKRVKFVTHAAPSGIARNTDIAIGPDVAFNPLAFASELKEAKELFGYNGRVLISDRAGVVLEYHQLLDAANERNGNGVGSTKRGIGPFYQDNARRTTRIPFGEYVSHRFENILHKVLDLKRTEIGTNEINLVKLRDRILSDHEIIRRELRGMEENLEYRMRDYLDNGDHIIIEGAQGTGLDVNMGDIPNVTSSHLLAPNAFATPGLPRRSFKVIGVEKIYATRVGKGNLPTQANDEFASVGDDAGEVGASTGRKRTVGYPDWLGVRRGVMLNDCDEIVLTRADCVQDREIKVCVAYDVNGFLREEVPRSLEGVRPGYSGTSYKWKLWDGHRDVSDALKVDDKLREIRQNYVKSGFNGLPESLQQFIKDHDKFVRCRTTGVSIGPASGETVHF